MGLDKDYKILGCAYDPVDKIASVRVQYKNDYPKWLNSEALSDLINKKEHSSVTEVESTLFSAEGVTEGPKSPNEVSKGTEFKA